MPDEAISSKDYLLPIWCRKSWKRKIASHSLCSVLAFAKNAPHSLRSVHARKDNNT